MIAIDVGQHRFDPLNFEDQMGLSPEMARKEALAARAVFIKEAKKQGFNAKGWTLTGQLRQYRSFGVPDGRIRNVYYVTVSHAL